MAPRVSVLIPTYDRPHFLREALASVLDQQCDSLEVVVGDDGNFGGDVIRDIGDDRVRYVRHPQRLGVARNWNRLIELARGEYVALLMDDDRLLPQFLTRCLLVAEEEPDVGVVFTDHLYDDNGSIRGRPGDNMASGRYDDFVVHFFEPDHGLAVSAALIKRVAALEATPLPDTAAADVVLFGRIADRGWPFYYIDEPLMVYRWHGANLSGTDEFRDAGVRAFESFEFSNSHVDRRRTAYLAASLVSRAKLNIQRGELERAAADLSRARHVAGRLGVRVRMLDLLCRSRALAWLATRAWRLASGLRGRHNDLNSIRRVT